MSVIWNFTNQAERMRGATGGNRTQSWEEQGGGVARGMGVVAGWWCVVGGQGRRGRLGGGQCQEERREESGKKGSLRSSFSPSPRTHTETRPPRRLSLSHTHARTHTEEARTQNHRVWWIGRQSWKAGEKHKKRRKRREPRGRRLKKKGCPERKGAASSRAHLTSFLSLRDLHVLLGRLQGLGGLVVLGAAVCVGAEWNGNGGGGEGGGWQRARARACFFFLPLRSALVFSLPSSPPRAALSLTGIT
jgi:hypothetical protein